MLPIGSWKTKNGGQLNLEGGQGLGVQHHQGVGLPVGDDEGAPVMRDGGAPGLDPPASLGLPDQVLEVELGQLPVIGHDIAMVVVWGMERPELWSGAWIKPSPEAMDDP